MFVLVVMLGHLVSGTGISQEIYSMLNVNLCFINPIRAPSAHPNVCDICDRKLWLSVGGAFTQLLAQSGYKRNCPGQGI